MRPDGGQSLGTDHREAGDDDSGADRALDRQLFLEYEARQREAAERRTGGLDDAAMGERHEQEAGIAEERTRRPAQHSQCHAPGPADTGEIAETGANDERQAQQPRPDEAMKHDVRRRKPDGDAVAGRNEAGRPEQGGARSAGNTQNDWLPHRGPGRGGARRSHGIPLRRSVTRPGGPHTPLARMVPWCTGAYLLTTRRRAEFAHMKERTSWSAAGMSGGAPADRRNFC